MIAVLLVAAVLLSAVLSLSVIVRRQAEINRAHVAIGEHLEAFRGFASVGTHPQTGEPITDPHTLLDEFLAVRGAGEGEVLLGYVDGTVVDRRGSGAPGLEEFDFLADPELLETVLQDSRGVASTSAGPMRWGQVPVQTSSGQAHFVVMEFTGHRMGAINRQTAALGAVGLVVMAGIGLVAWQRLRPPQ